MADADVVHLARFFFRRSLSLSYVLSPSPFFFLSMDGSTEEKKEIERNINYWIRIVYCLNNSTWFVVYEYMQPFERCESVLFYGDFLFLHTLFLSLLFVFLLE